MIKYHAGESFLHKLDPRVKIIMLLILTILVFVTRNFPVLGLVFLLIMICWKVSGISIRELGGYLKLLVGLVLFVVLI